MNWPIVPLGEVAEVVRGVTYRKEQARTSPSDGFLPLLRATNIENLRLKLDSELVYVPESVVRATQMLRRDDIVLASSSGSLSVVGKSARLDGPWHGTFGAFCAVIRAGGQIDPRYLALFLQSHQVRSLWSAAAKGTNINNLKRGDLTGTPVPVPPLDEQRRIIELLEDRLSRLDAAETGLRHAERRLLVLERSALDECFGAAEDGVLLSELVEGIQAGKSFGGANAPAAEDEWGIIKVSAMTWGEFRAEENKAVTGDRVDPRCEIREGDLLVSRANTSEYVGASVLVGPVRPRLLLSDKSLRVGPRSGVSSEWLWRALQAPKARSQISALATGTKDSMRNISQSSLLRVRVPSADPAAQADALRRFGDITSASGPTRSALADARRRSEVLRRSLLAAAFSGELSARTRPAV